MARLFVPQKKKPSKTPRRVAPSPAQVIPYSGYCEKPSEDGTIFRFLLPKGCVISGSAVIDSLSPGQHALLRVEAVDGGSEFSFPIEGTTQTLPLNIPCEEGTRIAITTKNLDIRGIWLSFKVRLNG